jgi:chromosome segregation ATPase
MGQTKQNSGSDTDLDKLQKQVQKLTKLTTKLQAEQKIMSKALKDMNKSLNFLTKTVENNKETLENFNPEPEELVNQNSEASIEVAGGLLKMDKEHFVSALLRLLVDLKKTDSKEYVEIKTVKSEFLERYSLENDADFDHWLLESYWSNEIELLSGISDYSVRDIYDNVYHKIRY